MSELRALGLGSSAARILLSCGLVLAMAGGGARAGDGAWTIIPGGSIGQVHIGMTVAEVDAALDRPPNRIRTLNHNLLEETWISKAPAGFPVSASRSLIHNFLTISFRAGQVVQLEVSSPDFKLDKISTNSSAVSLEKLFPAFRERRKFYVTTDQPQNGQFCAHYLVYEDSVAQGISWKYGVWSCENARPDSAGPLETIIVHEQGAQVLFNPNDALPWSGTGASPSPRS